MKKVALLFTILCAGALNGMENIPTISPSKMQNKDTAHRELLGKVKKLEGYDIYVGAGYSDAGEPIFFAMEKLNDKNKQIWKNYATVVRYQIRFPLINLAVGCSNNQKAREQLKDDLYSIKLMDMMCPNQMKILTMLDRDIEGGILGFQGILTRNSELYVAYASPQPIIGPFAPKTEVGKQSTLKECENAYSNIIISIGVDMLPETAKTEHRGVFKNPFYMISDAYKNIWLKLHGWAGTVEKQIFNKAYMTVYPTEPAANLLQKVIKPGDMYIGIDTKPYPYHNEELKRKFPSIKQELIGPEIDTVHKNREPLHVFELKVLSKYYTTP